MAVPEEGAQTVAARQWLFRLARDENDRYFNDEDKSIGPRSILTGRTIPEIREHARTDAKARREFQQMLADSALWFLSVLAAPTRIADKSHFGNQVVADLDEGFVPDLDEDDPDVDGIAHMPLEMDRHGLRSV